MVSFLNILGKLFGNKYDKDIKEIAPIVDEINKHEQRKHDPSNREQYDSKGYHEQG